jgi:DNA-binding transcriptional regulator YdaS (Cro superfamily)
MNTEDIIEKLGGEKKAAYLLDVHQTSIHYWVKRGTGIPTKYWHKIIKLTGITASDLLNSRIPYSEEL